MKCFTILCLQVVAAVCNSYAEANKRVCIIGAGVAGLSSARHLLDAGVEFTILEATSYIGGTWRYDARVGMDENGLPIYTSMYKHLRTNLPKPAMEFEGFPMPEDTPSFPSGALYYNYIESFVDHFDLNKHIRFHHNVTSIQRLDNLWKVKHKNVVTGEHFEEDFDFILVCTGHHSKPNMPNLPGEKIFKGTVIHSHDYREPDRYSGRRVLLVGAGPSGMDIGLDVADVAGKVVHSQHSKVTFRTPFPPNYFKKPDIQEFTENGVKFVDGSYEEVDDVLYCTGFQYYYPFLDESCGLTLQPRSVVPLYRYMVNINQPTMLLLGLVVRACIVAATDAQARYATALITGRFNLPPQEVMLQDWQRRADAIRARGRPLSDIHLLAADEDNYYANLTAEAGITRVPPVLYKIRAVDTEAKLENLYTYRHYEYTVLDNNTFTRRYKPPHETTPDNGCTP